MAPGVILSPVVTSELEAQVVINVNGTDLPEHLCRRLVRKQKTGNRGVEVLGSSPVHTDKRTNKHAALYDDAITPP